VRNALLNPVNWPRIPAVTAAMYASIKTDLSPLDGIAVGAAMLRDPGEPDHLVIDTALATELTGQDGAYLLQAKPSLKPTVAQFLNGSAAAAPSVPRAPSAPSASKATSVEVLNGAGVAGLAARTADRLTQAGFTVTNVGDAP